MSRLLSRQLTGNMIDVDFKKSTGPLHRGSVAFGWLLRHRSSGVDEIRPNTVLKRTEEWRYKPEKDSLNMIVKDFRVSPENNRKVGKLGCCY